MYKRLRLIICSKTMTDMNHANVEQILEQAKKLPSDDRATLISELLNTSELVVGFSSSYFSDSIVKQISMMSAKELGEILHAVAERIGDGVYIDRKTRNFS